MIAWAVTFAVFAIVASVFGFVILTNPAAAMLGKALALIFCVLAIAALIGSARNAPEEA